MKIRASFAVLLPALLAGCIVTRAERRATPVVVGTPRAPVGAVVFCATARAATAARRRRCARTSARRRRSHVEEFDWSHGRGRMLADHLDHGTSSNRAGGWPRGAGPEEAGPDGPVYLVAYSAGTAVVLAAAERPAGHRRSYRPARPLGLGGLRPEAPPLRSRRSTPSSAGPTGWCSASTCGSPGRPTGASATRGGPGRLPARGHRPGRPALYARLHQHPWEPSPGGRGATRAATTAASRTATSAVRAAADAAAPGRRRGETASDDHRGEAGAERGVAARRGGLPARLPHAQHAEPQVRVAVFRREAAAVRRADPPRLQVVRPAPDVAAVARSRGRAGRPAGCAGRLPCRTSRRTTPRRCPSCRTGRSRWAGTCRPGSSSAPSRAPAWPEVRVVGREFVPEDEGRDSAAPPRQAYSHWTSVGRR